MSKTIRDVSVLALKPDKNQPRKSFNLQEIEGLAKNIKTQGVINPIEIDKDNTIVTGECRWKAAQTAGLKEVPCIVNNIQGKERFKHQLSENSHHSTMSDMDVARALDKMLKDYGLLSPGESKKGSGGYNDKGLSWLAKELGKSITYVHEKLGLLQETKQFQKAVESKKIKPTMSRVIKLTPNKHKKKVRQKILKGDIDNRDGGIQIAKVLRAHPNKADKILSKSYKGMNSQKIIESLKDTPTEPEMVERAIRKELESGHDIMKQCNDLQNMLSNTPISEISKSNFDLVLMHLMKTIKSLKDYVKGQNVPAIIEGDVTDIS